MVFFFNYTATTEIYPLTLHDALPIFSVSTCDGPVTLWPPPAPTYKRSMRSVAGCRSEEHTSELQSRLHLVCRLLLEKKKTETNCRRCSHQRSLNTRCGRPPRNRGTLL